jgi:hypothetical protein
MGKRNRHLNTAAPKKPKLRPVEEFQNLFNVLLADKKSGGVPKIQPLAVLSWGMQYAITAEGKSSKEVSDYIPIVIHLLQQNGHDLSALMKAKAAEMIKPTELIQGTKIDDSNLQ